MTLFLDLKRNGSVLDSDGNVQYTFKSANEPQFKLAVYDEFGVSELVTCTEENGGLKVSAFDVPIGVLKRQGNMLKTVDGTAEIVPEKRGARICLNSETSAFAALNKNKVVLDMLNSDRTVLVIALAAAAMLKAPEFINGEMFFSAGSASESIGEAAADTTKLYKKSKKQLQLLASKQNKTQKTDIRKQASGTLKSALKAIKNAAAALKHRVKLKKREAIIAVTAAALGIALLVTGVAVSASVSAESEKLKESVALVKVKDKQAEAYFSVGIYKYSVPVSAKKYEDGATFYIYYTIDENGMLNNYYFSKGLSNAGIWIFIAGAVLLLGGTAVLFLGVPNAKGLRLKSMVSQQNDSEKSPITSSYSKMIDDVPQLDDIPTAEDIASAIENSDKSDGE